MPISPKKAQEINKENAEAQAQLPKPKTLKQTQANDAFKSALNTQSGVPEYFTSKQAESYKDAEVDFNSGISADLQRAQNQSGWEQLGGFLSQAAGEVVGGTVEGFGYLASLAAGHGRDEEGYARASVGNFLTEAGREIKEFSQDIAPIYQETPGEFNMSDSGWWAQNGVSLASVASILIPSTAVMKGASWLGKGAKVLSGLGKSGKAVNDLQSTAKLAQLVKAAPKIFGSAFLSRDIESSLEAAGIFEEQRQHYLNAGLGSDQADKLAGIAAADVYRKNQFMLGQDVLQYMSLLSPVSIAGSAIGRLALGVGGVASEGLEESYQYIVGEEAKFLSDKQSGLHSDYYNNKHWTKRAEEYAQDEELYTGAFFGSLGGAVFEYTGPTVHKLTESGTAKGLKLMTMGYTAQQARSVMEKTKFFSDSVKKAKETGNVDTVRKVVNDGTVHLSAEKAKAGSLDDSIAAGESALEKDDTAYDEHNKDAENPQGLADPKEKEFLAQSVEKQKEYKTVYDKHLTKTGSPEVASRLATSEILGKDRAKQVKESTGKAEALKAQIPEIAEGILTADELNEFNRQLKDKQNEANIKRIETLLEAGQLSERTQKLYKEKLKELKANRGVTDGTVATPEEFKGNKRKVKQTLSHADEVIKYGTDAMLADLDRSAYREEYMELSKPEKVVAMDNEAAQMAIHNTNSPAELNQVMQTISDQRGGVISNNTPIPNAYKRKMKEFEAQGMTAADERREEEDNKSVVAAKGYAADDTQMPLPVAEDTIPGSKAVTQDQVEAISDAFDNEVIAAEDLDPMAQAALGDLDGWNVAVGEAPEGTAKSTLPETAPLTPENKEVDLPATEKIFTPGKSLFTFAHVSVNNGGNATDGNLKFSTWLENGDIPVDQKEGLELRIELDENFPLPDNAEFLRDVPESNYDRVALKYVVMENGMPKKIDGVQLQTSVHTPRFGQGSEQGQQNELRGQRHIAITALADGKNAYSSILKVRGGQLRVLPNDQGQNENSVATLMPIDRMKFIMGVGNGIGTYGRNNDYDSTPTTFENGIVYLDTTDTNGETRPLRLNARKINPEEIKAVTDLLGSMLKGAKRHNNMIEDVMGFENMTYGEALDMLVSFGPRTKGSESALFIQDGSLHFGGIGNMNTADPASFDSLVPKISEFLSSDKTTKEKLRPRFVARTESKKLNTHMGIKSSDSYMFMGETYGLDTPYNKFLVDKGRITTNAQKPAIGNSLYTSPVVDVNPNFEVREGSKPVETVIGKPLTSTTKDNPFFRETKLSEGQFEIANVEQEVAWIKEVLSDVPVEVVRGLIRVNEQGETAYGAFKNGMIVLSNAMEQGTAYHEAFHAVSQLYLTPNERKAIYDEVRKKYDEPQGSDLWAEEKLAEDFRLFKISGNKTKNPQGIRGFFKRLVDTIKHVFMRPDRISKLYDNINKGYYNKGTKKIEVRQETTQDILLRNGLRGGGVYEVSKAIDLVNREGSEREKELVSRIEDTLKEVNPDIRVNVGTGIYEDFAGAYTHETNEVLLNLDMQPHNLSYVVAHELIHAATANQIAEGSSEAVQKLDELREKLIEDADPYVLSSYAMTNTYELIAELSNPEFVGILDSIEADKRRTLWDKIKGYIADLLGLKTGDRNLLESLLDDIVKEKPKSISNMTDQVLYRKIPGMPAEQTSAIASALVATIVRDSKAAESEDITLLTQEYLTEDYLKSRLEAFKEYTSRSGFAPSYDRAIDNVDILREKVIDKFKAMNLEVIPDNPDIHDSVQDPDSDEGNTNELSFKPAFEYSGKDNASGNIKLLISTLPKMSSLENQEYDVDPLTGLPRLVNLSATWGILADTLANTIDGFDKNGNFESAWSRMMDKLTRLSVTRPEFAKLREKLESDTFPDEKKAQFFNAFSQTKLNFRTTTVSDVVNNEGQKVGIRFTTKDSNFSTPEKKIKWAWKLEMDKEIAERGRGYLSNLADEYVTLMKDVTQAWKNKETDITPYKERFYDIINELGIDVHPGSLQVLLDQKDGLRPQKLRAVLTDMKRAFVDGLQEASANDIDWATNESTLEPLLAAEAMYRDDLTDSSVIGADGATYYSYSLNNYLSKLSNRFKQDPRSIDRMLASPYNTNSLFLKRLKNDAEIRKNFTVEVFNNFREMFGGDTGSKYTDMSPADEMSVRINQTLNGHFSMLTAADKGVWYLLKGLGVTNSGVSFENGNYNFKNTQILNQFSAYYVDELSRMKTAWAEVYGPNAIPENERVQYYHTGKEGEQGNAFKSLLFPNLSPENIDKTNEGRAEKLQIFATSNHNKPSYGTGLFSAIQPEIIKALTDRIQEDWDQAVELGVVYKNENGIWMNNSIDGDKLNYDNIPDTVDSLEARSEAALRNAMAEYSINALIANVETTKMFTGDPAFYKNMTDLQKRVPGGIAPGQDLLLKSKEDLQFKVSVLNDIKMTISDDLMDQYKDAIKKSNPKITDAQASKMLKAYKGLDVADAQGYITLDRYRFLLERLGKWRPSMNEAFERLKKGEVPRPEDKIFLNPLKGMYFGMDQRRSSMVPTYLKYSMAPLIPGMVRGTKLETLMNEAEAKGIDEIVFNSGVKAGAQGQVNVPTDGEFGLNPITLDNRNWKLQQDLSSKYMKKGKAIEGSQVLKNVIANMDLDATYANGRDGQKVLEEYIATDSALSDIGRTEFLREFGIEEADGQLVIPEDIAHNEDGSLSKLYTTLISELQGKNAPESVIDLLRQGVPLDSIPQFRKKIQQTLLSMLNKRTVKMDMPGGAFIQMSPGMLDYTSEALGSDITWLGTPGELKPPRMEGGVVKPGQVLLPQSAISKARKLRPEASIQEIAQEMKLQGLLEGVGYRIPNQDMASTDYVEVVGILPDYVGDTVIAFPQITGKTGSDYDIDKMYIMLPNYDVSAEGYITRTRMSEGKRGLQNKKLDLYKEILTAEETFARLVSPIDSEWMKEQANNVKDWKKYGNAPKEEIAKLKADAAPEDLKFFGQKTQFDAKRAFNGGKIGVAQGANQLVDHPLTQIADVAVSFPIKGRQSLAGKYDEKNGLITSNLSAYLNANVDIAKDPYIFDLNNNTYTSNTTALLIRLGIDPEWVNYFMSQPILVDMANNTLNGQGRTARAEFHQEGPNKGKPISAEEKTRKKYSGDAGVPFSIDRLPTKEQLIQNIKSPEGVSQNAILDVFLEMRTVGQGLGRQVSAFKFDTNGAGITLVDSIVQENKYQNALADDNFINVEQRMNGSMAQAYKRNSQDLALELFPSIFIGASNAIRGAMEGVNSEITFTDLVNSELATKIENDAYAYVMEKFPGFYSSNPSAFVSGDTSLAKKLMKLKQWRPTNRDALNNNAFIRALDVYEENGLEFVRLSSGKRGKDAQDTITEAWDALLNDELESIRNFAEDLVKYSVYSSGLATRGGSFFDLIPAEYLTNMGMDAFIKEQMGKLHDGDIAPFVRQFFRNNSEDSSIVKKVKTESMPLVKGASMDIGFGVGSWNKSFVIGKDAEGRPVMRKYVNRGGNLYQLQGYRTPQKGGDIGIYSLIATLGYEGERAIMKEYDKETSDYTDNVDTPVKRSFISRPVVPVSSALTDMDLVGLQLEIDDLPFQKNSEVGQATYTQEKMDIMQKNLGGVIKWDNNMSQIAQVERTAKGPVVTINPEKIADDTIIHEYAHVYISALGGVTSEAIKPAVDQLRGTKLWARVAEMYPELSGSRLEEEVLATAIGQKGSEIFEDVINENKWTSWIKTFWDKIKEFFGLPRDRAEALAREMISGQIQDTRYEISNEIMYQKSAVEEGVEDTKSAVEIVSDELRASIGVKIQNTARRLKHATSLDVNDQTRRNLYNEMLEMSRNMSKMEAIESIYTFADYAARETRKAAAWLNAEIEGDKLNVKRLNDIKHYIDTFEVVDRISSLIDKEEVLKKGLIPEGKLEELKTLVDGVQKNRRVIKNLYDEVSIDVLAREMASKTNLMTTRKREALEEQYKSDVPRGDKSKEEYKEDRDKWVGEQMSANIDSIRKSEEDNLKRVLRSTSKDISWIKMMALDPRAITDQALQIGVKLVDQADYKTNKEYFDTLRPMLTRFTEYMKDKKGLLAIDVKKVNEKFIRDGELLNVAQVDIYREGRKKGSMPHNEKLEFSEAEYEYLSMLNKLMEEADKMLPDNFKLDGKLPSVLKSTMERMQEEGIKGIAKAKKEDWVKTVEDILEGDTSGMNEKMMEVFANEKGEESKFVPIHFRRAIEPKDQSHDLFGIMLSNYYMALNYKNKMEIMPQMEMMKDAVDNRLVGQTDSKGRVKVLKDFMNKITKSGDTSNLAKAFDSLMDTRMYGIQMKDSGDIAGINVNKAMRNLMGYTGGLMLSFNPASAVSNVIQGDMARFIHSIGGKYYTMKDVLYAQKEYGKQLPEIAKDLGTTDTVESKINLVMQKFDMMGDNTRGLVRMLGDTAFAKTKGVANLNALTQMGEHYVQGALMISVMSGIKTYDKDGNVLGNLWEAYSVKDGEAVIDPKVASTSRDRLSKNFGTDQEFEISTYLKYINANHNGNYDRNNLAKAQTNMAGAMMIMMRKWIPRGIQTRFSGKITGKTKKESGGWADEQYVEQLKSFEQGRYITAANITGSIIGKIKEHKAKAISMTGKEMTEEEIKDMKMVSAELGSLAFFWIMSTLFANLGEDEKNKKLKNYEYFVALMAQRAVGDLTFYFSPKEIMKTANTPTVAIRPLLTLADIMTQLMSPTERWLSGKNEGELKLWTKTKEANVLLNLENQWNKDYERSYNYAKEGGIR